MSVNVSGQTLHTRGSVKVVPFVPRVCSFVNRAWGILDPTSWMTFAVIQYKTSCSV